MSTSRRAATACLVALAGSLAGPQAEAQVAGGPTEVVTAVRTMQPPAIDGRGDDPAWHVAIPTREFTTFAPREGGRPALATEVRVLYDDRTLYVLVRAYDPHPDSIVRRLARRDTDGPPNDQIQLFLDTYHDRRSGYEYIVNAAGVKSDYLLYDDSGFDHSWDGVWDVATSVDSLGWTAEYAIPFQQLRFTSHRAPTFGIMVWRLVGRSGERASFPAYRPTVAGLVSQFGTLSGLRDLARTASVEITPYALVRARNLPATLPTAVEDAREARLATHPAVGADLKWLPTPGISVDATINPDFAQADADPAVLDLSGVEVFQAERRRFFLEGAGLLSFPLAADGSSGLFHSRRIGRSPALAGDFGTPDSPSETTILGAGRLTARLAPATSLAALSAVTQQEEGARRPGSGGERFVIEPRTVYGVVRLQHDFRGGRSGVGLMITEVDRSVGDSIVAQMLPRSAHATAVTTQHQTTDGAYQASAWIASSRVRGDTGAIALLQRSPVHVFQRPDDGVAYDPARTGLDGVAGFVSVGKIGGGVTRFGVSYRTISPGFHVNDLGFLTRAGVQSWSATAGLAHTAAGRTAGLRYRSADLTLGFSGDWGSDGLPHGRGLSLTTRVQLPDQAQVQVQLRQQLPGAYCTAGCTRGGPAVVDPPRSTAVLEVTGDPRRGLIPHVNLEWNRDDGGRSRGVGGQADLTWRPRSNVEASLAAYVFQATYDSYFYGHFGDPVSDTTRYTVARLTWPTRSLTARANYAITRALTLQWYAQAYVSRGAYADVRELAEPRARRYADRFRPYPDTAVTLHPGGIDFRQLRSNAVLRWEYRPASVLYVVWSHGRDWSADTPGGLGLWPGREMRELFGLHPANAVAIKASYWFSR